MFGRSGSPVTTDRSGGTELTTGAVGLRLYFTDGNAAGRRRHDAADQSAMDVRSVGVRDSIAERSGGPVAASRERRSVRRAAERLDGERRQREISRRSVAGRTNRSAASRERNEGLPGPRSSSDLVEHYRRCGYGLKASVAGRAAIDGPKDGSEADPGRARPDAHTVQFPFYIS